jgi:hypothetical protein
VLLCAAPFHCRAGPVDLGPFVVALLVERRQQDDPPFRGDPVRDAARLVFKVEPQLAESALEVAAQRHPHCVAALGEEVQQITHAVEVPVDEAVYPGLDLSLGLDFHFGATKLA